jgi:hypothetical protein
MIPLAFKSYNVAQTFQVDPSQVKNSTEVGISRIDLYFRAKPPSENNKSGILNPGVEITIIPCINGVPDTNNVGSIRPSEPSEHGSRFTFSSKASIARKEWGEIIPSTDASSPTVFRFKQPIFVKTGQEYAVAVKFDGNEDFILWDNRKGNLLVNTTSPSPGNSRPFVGNLYKFISPIQPFVTLQIANTTNQTSDPSKAKTAGNIVVGLNQFQDPGYSTSNWKAVTDTNLKFKLYFARYYHNGYPVSENTAITSDPTITNSRQLNPNNTVIEYNSNTGVVSVVAQSEKNEYIVYENKSSNFIAANYGEIVYQVAPFYPGGKSVPLTVSVVSGINPSGFRVVASGNYPLPSANGLSFNSVGGFNNIYSLNGVDDEYIIVKSGNISNVRKIVEIVSNTELIVDEPFSFTNTAAYFFKAPVGKIKSIERTFIDGKGSYLLTLYDSNANSSVRFVNNSITSIAVTANGVGYNNTDYIEINGYESGNGIVGGYSATANIVTNAGGNVVSIIVSNNGAGFINASSALANYEVKNSSGLPVLTSVANSLTFSLTIDSRLETEFSSNNYFSNCKIINFDSMRGKPEITVNNPLGTNYAIRHKHLFYKKPAENSAGWSYHISPTGSAGENYLKIFKTKVLSDYSNSFVIPSRSNQFVATYEANNSVGNTQVLGIKGSNTSIMLFDITSNNDYSAVFVDPEVCRIHFSSYVINNDYTNEHTNNGNAFSKHITTKVNFAQDRFAEDLLVYLTAYRPLGTDLKIYARIHNSNDPEAFDDKDWTLLEEIEGNGIYSSKDDPSDYIELGYNFTAYPNAELTTVGTVTVVQGNTLVTGSNTSFTSGTSNLASDGLIRIFNPLFQNNYFIAVVNNVINSTAFHIKRSVGELSANGTGTVAITSGSVDIAGTSSKFLTDFANGDFIAVWANSTVYEVREINKVISDISMNVTSSFTSTNATSSYARVDPSNILNFSLAGSGLKLDKLQYPHQAFNNKANDNVVRYYSSSMVEFDTFNTFQLKIVMLSNNSYLVPKVDDVRAIGVSA